MLEPPASPPLPETRHGPCRRRAPAQVLAPSKPIHLQAKAKLSQGEGCAPHLTCARGSLQLDPFRDLALGDQGGHICSAKVSVPEQRLLVLSRLCLESLVAGPSACSKNLCRDVNMLCPACYGAGCYFPSHLFCQCLSSWNAGLG